MEAVFIQGDDMSLRTHRAGSHSLAPQATSKTNTPAYDGPAIQHAMMLQRTVGNKAAIQILSKTPAQKSSRIQRGFNEIVSKILNYDKDSPGYTNEHETTCSTTANHIYAAVSSGNEQGIIPAGNGQTVGSLVTAMSDAQTRENAVFIYHVNGDVFGHHFTIVQQQNQAMIIQGYLGKFTIAAWLENKGSMPRDVEQLKVDLTMLFDLRDTIKDQKFTNDEDVARMAVVHERLFGLGTELKEKNMLRNTILTNKTETMSWKASFAEGRGNQLNTKEKQEKPKKQNNPGKPGTEEKCVVM